MPMRRLSFLLLLTLATAPSLAEETDNAPADTLVAFSLPDQFDATHTDQELRGRVTLVMWADRKGNDHRSRWTRVLARELDDEITTGQVRLLLVAHLDGVPGFIKGRVMKRFKREDEPALLDWEGLFAATYVPEPDHLNLLVFDADGRLVHEAAAARLDQDLLDEVLAAVAAAIADGPPGPPVMLD